MFQLFNLGFKFRRTESISMDVMESIIMIMQIKNLLPKKVFLM